VAGVKPYGTSLGIVAHLTRADKIWVYDYGHADKRDAETAKGLTLDEAASPLASTLVTDVLKRVRRARYVSALAVSVGVLRPLRGTLDRLKCHDRALALRTFSGGL